MFTNAEYAERLNGRTETQKPILLNHSSAPYSTEKSKKALSYVKKALEREGIVFVDQKSVTDKFALRLTRFGVVVWINQEGEIGVGKLVKEIAATARWAVIDRKVFPAKSKGEIGSVVRTVKQMEQAGRNEAKLPFASLLKAIGANGVVGEKGDLAFTTHMGLVVSVRTFLHGDGVWATIHYRDGRIVNRTLEDPSDGNLYAKQIAGLIRRGELEELGWGRQKADLNYGTCNHKSRAVSHNCGCTETTTVTKRKAKYN